MDRSWLVYRSIQKVEQTSPYTEMQRQGCVGAEERGGRGGWELG